jgi:hypothetical protein
METWEERRLVPRILNPDVRWEWSDSRPDLFGPGERVPVPVEQEAGWAPELIWTLSRRGRLRSFDCPARNLVTVSTSFGRPPTNRLVAVEYFLSHGYVLNCKKKICVLRNQNVRHSRQK